MIIRELGSAETSGWIRYLIRVLFALIDGGTFTGKKSNFKTVKVVFVYE